jgi:flagellin-specific chaperone FliS
MPNVSAYQTEDRSTWTRIDMLVMLYARCLEHIQAILAAMDKGNRADEVIQRTRAAAIVATIRSGIVTEYGEIPQRIDQLAEFVQLALIEGDQRQLQSAETVIRKLSEGFEAIRDEATRMELTGELEPLSMDATVDTTV